MGKVGRLKFSDGFLFGFIRKIRNGKVEIVDKI